MSKKYMESQHFKDIDYTQNLLPVAEYEDCRFTNCNFAGSSLSDIVFVSCSFEACDLSNAKLNATAFKSVKFSRCKLLGLHFDDCNPFLLEMGFEHCQLDYAIFYKIKLRNTRFLDCQLLEVDFVEADLSNAVFQRCELNGSAFENTNLEGADLRTASNFSIDPTMNRVKKARFSAGNAMGLLNKFGIRIE